MRDYRIQAWWVFVALVTILVITGLFATPYTLFVGMLFIPTIILVQVLLILRYPEPSEDENVPIDD